MHAIAGMFHAHALVTRPNASRDHSVPKSACNAMSNSARNSGRATYRSPIKMPNISIKTRA